MKWWCTPCQKWVEARKLGHSIGRVCTVCGSGRVRPPTKAEEVLAK